MFYNPQFLKINGTQIIIYPSKDLEKVLDRNKQDSVKNHLKSLYYANNFPADSEYHIVILWNEGEDVMSDIWIFTKIKSWGSGPLVDVRVFRGMKREYSIGVSAGNGLVMLGREEEHRKKKKSLTAYFKDPRPKLPSYLALNEDFEKAK